MGRTARSNPTDPRQHRLRSVARPADGHTRRRRRILRRDDGPPGASFRPRTDHPLACLRPSTLPCASHNPPDPAGAGRGKGRPQADPEGTRSALPATEAAGTLIGWDARRPHRERADVRADSVPQPRVKTANRAPRRHRGACRQSPSSPQKVQQDPSVSEHHRPGKCRSGAISMKSHRCPITRGALQARKLSASGALAARPGLCRLGPGRPASVLPS